MGRNAHVLSEISVPEEQDVFYRAIELPREGRGAFVRAACLGDEALRQEVERLVKAHQTGEGILNRPCVESGTIALILHEMSSHLPED